MVFYVVSDREVIAEIEASSAFLATCTDEADSAPVGSVLVELETGDVVAQRAEIARGLVGWSFVNDLFGEECDTKQRRGAA